jgi:hypothetical protein
MKQGRIFLIVLGIFYLLNLAMTQPFASHSLFNSMYPGVAPSAGTPAFNLLTDAWFVVGLQLGAIGVVALIGSSNPRRYIAVFDIVIATEIVDAVWDFYSITWRQEAANDGIKTLVIHAVVIGWAMYARRRVLQTAS